MPNLQHAVPAAIMGVIGMGVTAAMKALYQRSKSAADQGYALDPLMLVESSLAWHRSVLDMTEDVQAKIGKYPRSVEKQAAVDRLAKPATLRTLSVAPAKSAEERLTSADTITFSHMLTYTEWIANVARSLSALEATYPRLSFATEAKLTDELHLQNPLGASVPVTSFRIAMASATHRAEIRRLEALRGLASRYRTMAVGKLRYAVSKDEVPTRSIFEMLALSYLWDYSMPGLSERPVEFMGAKIPHHRARGMVDFTNVKNGDFTLLRDLSLRDRFCLEHELKASNYSQVKKARKEAKAAVKKAGGSTWGKLRMPEKVLREHEQARTAELETAKQG